jgi:hypothetical protein
MQAANPTMDVSALGVYVFALLDMCDSVHVYFLYVILFVPCVILVAVSLLSCVTNLCVWCACMQPPAEEGWLHACWALWDIGVACLADFR